MATITLPVHSLRWDTLKPTPVDFEIDKLSFTRSIVRQGEGARKAWRNQFSHNRFELIPQSHEVLAWNERRLQNWYTFPGEHLHGIRAGHRRSLALMDASPEDPWAMIDGPSEIRLHTDEQAAPGSDDL